MTRGRSCLGQRYWRRPSEPIADRDREQDDLTTRAVRFSDAIFPLGISVGITSQTAVDRSAHAATLGPAAALVLSSRLGTFARCSVFLDRGAENQTADYAAFLFP